MSPKQIVQTPSAPFEPPDRGSDGQRASWATPSPATRGGQAPGRGPVRAAQCVATITAGFLFEEFFDFRPQLEIWLAANHKPGIRGSDHCLAVKDDGSLWAWGSNSQGMLGVGGGADSVTPLQVSDLSSVEAIATGGYHSLALLDDGSLWAWGDNGYGQLGDGTTTDSSSPVEVGGGLSGVAAIAAGQRYSVALLDDGSVYAWGSNEYGQLGFDTWSPQPVPCPE
jgi:hypothetical protein